MAIKEAFTMRKLVATGAVIALIGTSGAYFVSKNTQIQDRITKLFNVAGNYKAELANAQENLDAKNDILAGLRDMLKLGENATLDDFKKAINDKASSESTADVQVLLNKIATEKLGLPATAEDGSTINYTQDEVLNEIYTLHDEITELENYINTYVEEGHMVETPYAGMTLKEKVQSMINQLTQASAEDEAQLKLANDKLVALGYCPEHGTKFNSNGRCNVKDCEYAKVENVPDNGNGGSMSLPNSGGSSAETPAGAGGSGGSTNPVTPPTQDPVEEEQPKEDTQLAELQANVNTKKAEFETSMNKLVKSDCQTGSMSDTVKENLLNGTYSVIDGGGYYHIVDGSGTVKVKLWKNSNAGSLYSTYNAWVTAKQALADYQAQ